MGKNFLLVTKSIIFYFTFNTLVLHLAVFLTVECRFQGAEIPEKVLRTVRVSVSTHSKVVINPVFKYTLTTKSKHM